MILLIPPTMMVIGASAACASGAPAAKAVHRAAASRVRREADVMNMVSLRWNGFRAARALRSQDEASLENAILRPAFRRLQVSSWLSLHAGRRAMLPRIHR